MHNTAHASARSAPARCTSGTGTKQSYVGSFMQNATHIHNHDPSDIFAGGIYELQSNAHVNAFGGRKMMLREGADGLALEVQISNGWGPFMYCIGD